jgi:hypothetical protein
MGASGMLLLLTARKEIIKLGYPPMARTYTKFHKNLSTDQNFKMEGMGHATAWAFSH